MTTELWWGWRAWCLQVLSSLLLVKRKSSRRTQHIDGGSGVTAGDFGLFHCGDLFEEQCLLNIIVKADKERLWQQVSNIVMRAITLLCQGRGAISWREGQEHGTMNFLKTLLWWGISHLPYVNANTQMHTNCGRWTWTVAKL